MDSRTCFDLENAYGHFMVSQLVTPDRKYTTDILVVTHDDVDTQTELHIIAYTSGATLMTEEDVILFFHASVAQYMADHVAESDLRTALKTMFYPKGENYITYSWER